MEDILKDSNRIFGDEKKKSETKNTLNWINSRLKT